MNKLWYDLLLRSFDMPLAEEEQQALETGLRESEELRSTKQNITALRNALHSGEHHTFKPYFAERVMRRLLARQQLLADRFLNVFRPIAVGAAILVFILSTYNLSRTNTITLYSVLGIQQRTLEQTLALEAPFE
jgi:hypothetical protein